MIKLYPVEPVSAPRQVRKDAWRPSPPVLRYRAYRDELKIRGLVMPENFHHAVFVLAMPDSWPKDRKAEHEGMPHRQKPDRDNLEKALLDSAFGEDCHVWNGSTTKIWGRRGLVLVSSLPLRTYQTPLPMDALYRLADEWRSGQPSFPATDIGWHYYDC